MLNIDSFRNTVENFIISENLKNQYNLVEKIVKDNLYLLIFYYINER